MKTTIFLSIFLITLPLYTKSAIEKHFHGAREYFFAKDENNEKFTGMDFYDVDTHEPLETLNVIFDTSIDTERTGEVQFKKTKIKLTLSQGLRVLPEGEPLPLLIAKGVFEHFQSMYEIPQGTEFELRVSGHKSWSNLNERALKALMKTRDIYLMQGDDEVARIRLNNIEFDGDFDTNSGSGSGRKLLKGAKGSGSGGLRDKTEMQGDESRRMMNKLESLKSNILGVLESSFNEFMKGKSEENNHNVSLLV